MWRTSSDRWRPYRSQIKRLDLVEVEEDIQLDDSQTRERDRYRAAIQELQQENQDNYALSYLSNDGFFPGYAMGRESCLARCLDPFKELSRPASVGLREFTPATSTYADGRIFRVDRIDFNRLLPGEGEQARALARKDLLVGDKGQGLTVKGQGSPEGGETTEMPSLLLGGVELRVAQRIDDTRDTRGGAPFDIRGQILDKHDGGWQGAAQAFTVRYFANCHILLANLGVTGAEGNPAGFPVCPACGHTRNPGAPPADLERFRDDHKKHCKVGDFPNSALHVELASDVLIVGSFGERAKAVNAMEGLLLGCGHVLDMGSAELEGIILPGADETCEFAIYDPVPGGSGFLPQIVKLWPVICDKAAEVLAGCPEEVRDGLLQLPEALPQPAAPFAARPWAGHRRARRPQRPDRGPARDPGHDRGEGRERYRAGELRRERLPGGAGGAQVPSTARGSVPGGPGGRDLHGHGLRLAGGEDRGLHRRDVTGASRQPRSSN